MANIKPVGIDLATGQSTDTRGSDVLRPDEGDLTISSGSTQLDGTVLTLRAGDGNLTIDSEGGSVFIIGGTGNDNAIGGHVEITCGNSGAISGDGGSFTVVAGSSIDSGSGGSVSIEAGGGGASGGDGGAVSVSTGVGLAGNSGDMTFGTANASGSTGSISFTVGTTPNIATAGGISLITPGGYQAQDILIQSGGSSTGGGGLVRIIGGQGIELTTPDIVAGASSQSITIDTGSAAGVTFSTGGVSIDVGEATGGAIAGSVSLGLSFAQVVNVGGNATSLCFYQTNGSTQQTVSGSRADPEQALADLLAALANLGLIVNTTTA